MGFPTHVSYSDVNSALRGLRQAILEASQNCALEGYAFYLVQGDAAQIYINPRTLETAIKLQGKQYRLQLDSLEDMELLDGGHLPIREEDASRSSQSNDWDMFGDVSF